MRILSVLPAPATPGGMIFARRQIASLERLGIENETHFIPSKDLKPLLALRSFLDLRKKIRKYDPDIVHVHYGILYSFMTAFSGCTPLVITFQGSDVNKVKSKGLFRNYYNKLLSNLSVLRAGTIICVSPNLVKNLWWRRKRTVIIPPGIDLEQFRVMDRQESRKMLNWDPDEKVILFNANNPLVKRLDIALATLEILKKEVPGARMEILDGSLPDETKIPVMLNASDALLICSDSEGSPTMVKEALACNCPVVGVDVGDVCERLKGVKQSIVVEKDPVSLAGALKKVLLHPEIPDGRAKLIADGLSEEETARKILKIYEQLALKR
jgi:glycosyltransferase involved in cell wall biosynthesis